MSGFERRSRQSATRRFSPPESFSTLASHGGSRSASDAISSWCSSSGAGGGDHRLELRLLLGELVEVGVGLGVGGVDLVEPLLGGEHVAETFLDRLAHGLRRIELRLLRQVADAQVRHRDRLALEVLVLPGHDPEQGRLARAVQAEHADLRAGEEAERDVLEDDALGRHDLAHAPHGVDVLRHSYDPGIDAEGGRDYPRFARGVAPGGYTAASRYAVPYGPNSWLATPCCSDPAYLGSGCSTVIFTIADSPALTRPAWTAATAIAESPV